MNDILGICVIEDIYADALTLGDSQNRTRRCAVVADGPDVVLRRKFHRDRLNVQREIWRSGFRCRFL